MFNTSRNCAMPLVKCNEVTSFTIMILSKRKIICWFTFSKLRVVQVHSLSQFQDLWWSVYIFGKQCWIIHWTYRIWFSSIALFKCQPPLAIEYQVQVPFLYSGDTEETCFYCQFKLTFLASNTAGSVQANTFSTSPPSPLSALLQNKHPSLWAKNFAPRWLFDKIWFMISETSDGLQENAGILFHFEHQTPYLLSDSEFKPK